jgi:sugar O-acyltransferase (sialic acid O-acetyltransferase NeuD family)
MAVTQLNNMQIYLIGAGGFAGEVIEAFETAHPDLKLAGVFDDDTRLIEKNATGLPYLGVIEEFLVNAPPSSFYVLAIGDNEIRERLDERFSGESARALTVIHPAAVVSPQSKIEDGAYIGAFAFVGPRCSIGRQALINVGASIGHDAVLGDYCQICPGARVSGYVKIGRGAFLASNSVVPPGGKIGAYAKLAANSFAARPVPDKQLALGVPARIIS